MRRKDQKCGNEHANRAFYALAKYSDAMPLVKLADFVLFVAREGYTTKHSLEYIASVVEMTGKKNAACIMNGVKD